MKYYSVCPIAVKFHSYNHDNVTFIERIKYVLFSCHRYEGKVHCKVFLSDYFIKY